MQYQSAQREVETANQTYFSYTENAEATVTKILPKGHRRGIQFYEITFLNSDGKEIITNINANLLTGVGVNDKIAIRYNPENPNQCESEKEVDYRTNWLNYTMFSFVK